MDVFFTGLIVLAVFTAVFYIVFFSLIFYWHLKNTSYVVVPMVFAFKFFATGVLILVIASIILNYLPYWANFI